MLEDQFSALCCVGTRNQQSDDRVSRRKQKASFRVPEVDFGSKKFNWCPVTPTHQNVNRARRYVDQLDSGGGTMMVEGIRAALRYPQDDVRQRFVVFLTDGFIGNESEILTVLKQELGTSRVFGFGIGSSPNKFLLDRMSRAERGAVAYVGLGQDSGAVMDLFFDRVSHPAMMDVTFDWGAMDVADVCPARIPDLFVGRPVVVTRTYRGDAAELARQPIR